MYPNDKSFLLLLMLLVFGSCASDDDVSAPCALTPDPGPCEAAIKRYYFDPETQECKEFLWGGCGGTVPFEALEACRSCTEG